MGVGRLGIVDRDAVELSNLHRQIAHTEADVGVHKADSGAPSPPCIMSMHMMHSFFPLPSPSMFPAPPSTLSVPSPPLPPLTSFPHLHAAAASARAINSSCIVEAHREGISPSNAVRLVSQYDVVVDATDNVPSRYLLSDACIAAKRPLVSGAAIGTGEML